VYSVAVAAAAQTMELHPKLLQYFAVFSARKLTNGYI
jgi:hypothetical protein